jgi:hypothetical protein
MENYPISISLNKTVHQFEVGEYLHHDGERCKFKVFREGVMVSSFEPDAHEFLHLCQNPGGLGEELINLLADEIEAHHPQGIYNNPKNTAS